MEGVEATAVIDGVTIQAKSITAGDLAESVTGGEPDAFKIIAATIVEPEISEDEVRRLPPRVFARLAALAEEVNGTDEKLE